MNYPGVNQPAWWYAQTSASNVTWGQLQAASTNPYAYRNQHKAAAPPKPKTNVERLRERVAEVCDLAFEAAG